VTCRYATGHDVVEACRETQRRHASRKCRRIWINFQYRQS
jgi:hypothetical protein